MTFMKVIGKLMVAVAAPLLLPAHLAAASASNVNAPDHAAGDPSGPEVMAGSNASGTTDKVFTLSPSGTDKSYTVVIRKVDGTDVTGTSTLT